MSEFAPNTAVVGQRVRGREGWHLPRRPRRKVPHIPKEDRETLHRVISDWEVTLVRLCPCATCLEDRIRGEKE